VCSNAYTCWSGRVLPFTPTTAGRANDTEFLRQKRVDLGLSQRPTRLARTIADIPARTTTRPLSLLQTRDNLLLRVACPRLYQFCMTGLDCIAALKALGEESRLRILRLLFKEQLGVNEISQRLKASQYNVSKHLRIMREAGLLEVEKQGKQRLYTVASKLKNQVAANDNILDLGCCTFRFDKLPK